MWACGLALALGAGLGTTSPAQASPVSIDITHCDYNSLLNDGSNQPVIYSL